MVDPERGPIVRQVFDDYATGRFTKQQVLQHATEAGLRNRRGRPRHTSYSCERNGLEGALDKALKARTSCGAPMPDRQALLRLLKRVFRAGADATA